MDYSVESISLLVSLEGYIPYMSEEELLAILWYGVKPDNGTICIWEMRRQSSENSVERRFKEAYSRQK